MDILRTDLYSCGQERDTVIVIDVLRAFTTSACAFAAGAVEIILVAGVAEAFQLKRRLPGLLLAGEVNGYPVEGFDFGNSPTAMLTTDLSGQRLVLRTSAGTQGVVRSAGARRLFATGLCTAGATIRAIREMEPRSLTLVQTGSYPGRLGDEDRTCAGLIAARLQGGQVDPDRVRARVRASQAGRKFRPDHPVFPLTDLEAALEIDRFDFAMRVTEDGGLLRMRPFKPSSPAAPEKITPS